MYEILKRKFEMSDGDTWFGFILWCALFSLFIVGVNAIFADHSPKCYYLASYGTDGGVVYKLKANENWYEDSTAFSHHDYKVVMEIYNQLPKCTK